VAHVAVDSKRKDAMQLLLNTLALINGAGVYHYNLTGTNQIAFGADTDEQRLSQHDQTLRVYDGDEEHRMAEVTGGLFIATLECIVELLLRGRTAASIIEEFNDLLSDVVLCIGANRLLGGTVHYAEVFRIEAPAYDFDSNTASALCIVRVVYEYEPGSA